MALFDQTSFGKLLVTGPDATELLQWLCTADVAVEVGRAVYTGMLNERGGYEADVTVTRTRRTEYLLVTSSGSVSAGPILDRAPTERRRSGGQWLTSRARTRCYGVMGPNSRDLLQRLTREPTWRRHISLRLTSRQIDLGHATVRATRITYVGELGWELYVPTEFAVGVYEDLFEAGQALGLTNAGYYSINSLRLDKGYRAWGPDLTPDVGPVEAGLTVRVQTGDNDRVPRAGGGGEDARGRTPTASGLVPARPCRHHDVGRRAGPTGWRAASDR